MTRALALLGTAAALAAGGGAARSKAAPAPVLPGVLGPPQVLLTGLDVPWSVAFLPGGDALISERGTARILQVSRSGGRYRARQVMRVPGVDAAGEGGLLGLAVPRTYERDGLVYAYFTSDADDNRIVRFRLGGRPQPVVTGIPSGGVHNGGRIAFGPDGMLYAGTGDAGDTSNSQNVSSLGGKILRMRPDGSVPRDNPFPRSRAWTYGHRNVQGLGWDRQGRMFASEFGQNTWDEVNRIVRGRNYGWPQCEGRCGRRGFAEPLVVWSTGEASPSGLAVTADAVYVAALRGQRLWRIPLRNGRLGRPQPLLVGTFGRIRSVTVAPDGALWLTTTNRDGYGSPRPGDDRLIRIPRA